jgi:hypothetical protein
VVTAVNAFLATLDDTKRDQVEYDFSANKARQTWSNYPTTTVPREGIVLSDLTAEQQTAALAVLQTALSGDGYQRRSDPVAARQRPRRRDQPFIFPVVVGQGARLFPDAGQDRALDLVGSRATPSGVTTIRVYWPAGRLQYGTATADLKHVR